jgi:hypothetical protein
VPATGEVAAAVRLVAPGTFWSGSAGQFLPADGQQGRREQALLAVRLGPLPPAAAGTTETLPAPDAAEEMPVKDVEVRAPEAQGIGLADAPAPDVADLGQDIRNFLRRLTAVREGLPPLRSAFVALPVAVAVGATLFYAVLHRRRRKTPLPGAVLLAAEKEDEGSTETWLPSSRSLSGEDLV